MQTKLQHAIDDIHSRLLPDGGFCNLDGGPPSSEATAWAAIALKASSSTYLDTVKRACDWLASIQHSDGRVVAVEGYDSAFWPTPLCILAWRGLERYQQSIKSAIGFILRSKGQHFARKSDSPMGHDPSIVGWAWIDKTHSWIEPSCMSVIALKSCGYKDHPRTREAVRMILDRQLPSGGWNYGNTTVFNKELLPIPENTGQALYALGEMTNIESVKRSLDYLYKCISDIRTPLALTWMLFGLAMWSPFRKGWEDLIIESLELQSRYGQYDTVLLSLLVSVYFTRGKLTETKV